MKSMKMSAEDRKDQAETMQPKAADEFPYGLRVRLDDQSIGKVGMQDLPKVGTKMMMAARVEVVSTGQNASESGKNQHVELQITHLDFGPDQEEKGESAEDKLYGGS